MRSGARYLLSVFLLLTLAACSKKPSDTASNSIGQDMAAPSNAAGGNAMSSPAAPEPQPVGVPAGTALTVKLGETFGSQASTPGQPFPAPPAPALTEDGDTPIPRAPSVARTVRDP